VKKDSQFKGWERKTKAVGKKWGGERTRETGWGKKVRSGKKIESPGGRERMRDGRKNSERCRGKKKRSIYKKKKERRGGGGVRKERGATGRLKPKLGG